MNRTESAIFRTVSWYALFDYPLTRDELYTWMFQNGEETSRGEIDRTLETSMVLRAECVQEGAYIGRKGTSGLAQVRDERTHDAIRKFARVHRAVQYLKRVPGVIGIAAGNTLAFSHTRESSDIDLFVITKPGQLWSSRLLCVAPFILTRERPGVKTRDPFCFSFFASEDALNLERLSIPGGDPYLAVWARSLVPVYDAGGVFERFHKLNVWTNRFIPQAAGRALHPTVSAGVPVWKFPKFIPETWARKLQERRFPQPIRDLLNKDSRVIANEEYLKFHDQDRREEYRDQWLEECRIHGV